MTNSLVRSLFYSLTDSKRDRSIIPVGGSLLLQHWSGSEFQSASPVLHGVTRPHQEEFDRINGNIRYWR